MQLPHEPQTAERLRAYLVGQEQERIEKNLEELMTLEGGFVERFQYFSPQLPDSAKKRALISGSAIGSELAVARRFGFEELFGTEIESDLVSISKDRFKGIEGFTFVEYDGKKLPFEDDYFSFVYSGHIIEHTPSPFRYFQEHLRVLKPGGYFFLEFPDRYHTTELHTGLPSYEKYPFPLRDIALGFKGSRLSGGPAEKRALYRTVRMTIKPVSVWQIKLFGRLSAGGAKVIDVQRPAPGFTRVLLKKNS